MFFRPHMKGSPFCVTTEFKMDLKQHIPRLHAKEFHVNYAWGKSCQPGLSHWTPTSPPRATSLHQHLKHHHKHFFNHIYPGRGPAQGNTCKQERPSAALSRCQHAAPHFALMTMETQTKSLKSHQAAHRGWLQRDADDVNAFHSTSWRRRIRHRKIRQQSLLTASWANLFRQLCSDIGNYLSLMQIECIC